MLDSQPRSIRLVYTHVCVCVCLCESVPCACVFVSSLYMNRLLQKNDISSVYSTPKLKKVGRAYKYINKYILRVRLGTGEVGPPMAVAYDATCRECSQRMLSVCKKMVYPIFIRTRLQTIRWSSLKTRVHPWSRLWLPRRKQPIEQAAKECWVCVKQWLYLDAEVFVLPRYS